MSVLLQDGIYRSLTYSLETQDFIANRLCVLSLQEEATEVYKQAYQQALAYIPKSLIDQITWSEVNKRLAHGTLLGLMPRRDKV